MNVKVRALHEGSRLSLAPAGRELRRLVVRLSAAAADARRGALSVLGRVVARLDAGLGEGGAQSARAARRARRLGDVYGRSYDLVR